MEIVKLMYSAYPEAVSTISPGGCLPIHALLYRRNDGNDFPYENGFAMNCFRFLLSKYPESVDITFEGGDTLYRYALRYGRHSCFTREADRLKRLVLRVQPSLYPNTFMQLNYAARRMALFVGCVAHTEDAVPTLLRKISISASGDILFRLVLSFL